MSTPSIRPALAADRDRLVRMMGAFYAETGFPFDAARAGRAFDDLLADPGRGRAWILLDDGEAAGYFVLTLGFSMEFGGPCAFLDDLWVRPASRGRGLGKLALSTLDGAGASLGVRAIHLEVDPENERALALYRGAGFRDRSLRLMTRTLEPPLHR